MVTTGDKSTDFIACVDIIFIFVFKSFTMQRKTTLLFVFIYLIINLSTFSQSIQWSFKWSKETIKTVDNGQTRIFFAAEQNDNFYVLRENIYRGFRMRRFYLEKLNKELESIETSDITDALNESDFEIENIIHFNNEVLILSSSYNKSNKRYSYFYQKIDFNLNELTHRVLIAEVEATGNLPHHFTVTISEDQSLVLFSIIPIKREPILSKQENDYRFVMIMDKNFIINPLQKIQATVNQVDFNIVQTILSNTGTIFYLATKILDRKSESLRYFILKYENNELFAGAIDVKEEKNATPSMTFNAQNNILISGFYEENVRFNPGMIFYTTEFNVIEMRHGQLLREPMRNEILLPGLTQRQKKKVIKENAAGRDYKLLDQLRPIFYANHPSGEITLVAENQFVAYETSGLAMGGTLNRTIYNYNDLYAFRITASGKILWITKIPKRYRSSFDLVQSFQLIEDGEELHIFFNDNKLNLDFDTKKGVRYLSERMRHNFLAHVHLNAEGKQKRKIMLDYEDEAFENSNMIHLYLESSLTNLENLIFASSALKFSKYGLIQKN